MNSSLTHREREARQTERRRRKVGRRREGEKEEKDRPAEGLGYFLSAKWTFFRSSKAPNSTSPSPTAASAKYLYVLMLLQGVWTLCCLGFHPTTWFKGPPTGKGWWSASSREDTVTFYTPNTGDWPCRADHRSQSMASLWPNYT